MILYQNAVKDGDKTYSLDMARFTIRWNEEDAQAFMNWLTMFELEVEDKQFKHYYSSKLFTYRHMFSIGLGDSTVALGVDFMNASRNDSIIGFVEFNPNKVAGDRRFKSFMNKLHDTCKEMLASRWDLAIDIPVSKERLHLVKDKRNYELHVSHSGVTEYLGVRNNDGRVKLYDKKRESGLEYELTRLEITIDGLKPFEEVSFPTVAGSVAQLEFCAELELNDTEKVLYELLLGSDDMANQFKRLGRKMQKKLKPYLFAEDMTLEYSKTCYFEVCQQVRAYEIHLFR